MKILKTFIFSLFFLSSFNAFAFLDESQCNYNAAYSAGYNDAKSHRGANGNFAAGPCWNKFSSEMEKLNNSYNTGYRAGEQSNKDPNKAKQENVNCVESFGKKACGFDCKTTPWDAKCAERAEDNCVVDDFHNIVCGLHCRKEFMEIRCDG